MSFVLYIYFSWNFMKAKLRKISLQVHIVKQLSILRKHLKVKATCKMVPIQYPGFFYILIFEEFQKKNSIIKCKLEPDQSNDKQRKRKTQLSATFAFFWLNRTQSHWFKSQTCFQCLRVGWLNHALSAFEQILVKIKVCIVFFCHLTWKKEILH